VFCIVSAKLAVGFAGCHFGSGPVKSRPGRPGARVGENERRNFNAVARRSQFAVDASTTGIGSFPVPRCRFPDPNPDTRKRCYYFTRPPQCRSDEGAPIWKRGGKKFGIWNRERLRRTADSLFHVPLANILLAPYAAPTLTAKGDEYEGGASQRIGHTDNRSRLIHRSHNP
jgi:hypothetical protein